MPHTASRYQQDLGFTDGRVFASAGELALFSSAGSFTVTRTAAATWSVLAAVNTVGFIAINVTNQILRRTGFFEDTQNAFGSTFGSGLQGFVAGPSGSPGVGIPGSASPQGRPDTLGAMAAAQQIQPRRALKVKGFKLLGFDVIYTVTANPITTITSRVDQALFVNGQAIAITNVLPSAANGLQTAVSATPYVINTVIPNPVYSNIADQQLWVEIGLTEPAAGTSNFFGIDLIVEYNFN